MLCVVVGAARFPSRGKTGVGARREIVRAPRGFHYQRRRNNALRHFLRDVRLRTLAGIKAALDDIDAVVARVAKRVRWRARWGGLVMRAAPRDVVAPRVAAFCTEAADTS